MYKNNNDQHCPELNLLATVSDWAWRADSSFNITDAVLNPTHAAGADAWSLLGYRADQLIGTNLLSIHHSQLALNHSHTTLEDTLYKQQAFTNLFVLTQHADGSPKLLCVNGGPRFSANGDCLGYQGICTVVEYHASVHLVLEHFQHNLADRLGSDYFNTLVKSLAETLKIDWVWVARFKPGKQKVLHTLSVWGTGSYQENFSYPLAGTACERAIRERAINDGQRGVYTPLHPDFSETVKQFEPVEGHYGHVLKDSAGEPIGVICCMSRNGLQQKAFLERVVQVIAERCESELLRLQSDEELRLQKGTLDKAQRMTGFAAWRYELDQDALFFNDISHDIVLNFPVRLRTIEDVMKVVLPEYRPKLELFWGKLLKGAQLEELTFPLQTTEGLICWMQTIASGEVSVDAANERTGRIMGVVKDVTEERFSGKRLRLLTEAVAQSSNAISITDLNGTLIYVNPAFVHITGYDSDEILGQSTGSLNSGLTPPATYRAMWENLLSGRPWQGDLNNQRQDGTLYWASTLITPLRDEEGEVTNYLSVQEDISLRKEQEEQLVYQAHHDALTSLPNRFLAIDRLTLSMKHSRRLNQHVSLMFIDLDNFKQVNDSLGHAAGDILLVKVAKRLQSTLRDGDTVARLGGDEFLVILESANAKAAELSAKRIMHVLRAPMSIVGREVVTTCSIGITEFPHDGKTPEILMRNADAAMYKAKAAGKNTFQFFTQAMNDESQKRLQIETELRRAISRQEIRLVYQPIVDTYSKEVIGAEALARWNNELLGDVSPLEFIPLAEELGLIVDIGDYIISQAVEQCAKWSKTQPGFLMAINVSPRQLRDTTLKDSLMTATEKHGVNSKQIMLEVTEGVLVDNVDAALLYLNDLSNQGFQLAIDDFGTGYSSLSYLKTFPFNRLKIDRSFIHDALHSPEGETLVRVMAVLGHQFGMTIVAEGVEDASQEQFIQKVGIDAYQGNYFSEPLSPGEFSYLVDY